MHPVLAVLVAVLLAAAWPGAADAALPDGIAAGVFKVQALSAHGHANFGSAVLVAPGKLATNCHVTRYAHRIVVSRDGQSWTAQPGHADVTRDLCILSAAGVQGTVVSLDADELHIGQPVTAVGYPDGGELVASNGHVKALYRYDGAEVIQGSAPFDQGASGGGLFDGEGRLVGILTFKARAGGDFHFALPVQWLRQVLGGEQAGTLASAPAEPIPFWQRAGDAQPFFLRAAALEAKRNWRGLLALAWEWLRYEPHSAEPWLAVNKAQTHLESESAPASR